MKFRSIFIAAFLMLIAAILIFSLYYLKFDGVILNSEDTSLIDAKAKPLYHFVIIAQNTDDPFWQSIKNGVLNAGKEYNAAVEFNGPRFTNMDEQLQYLDIAIASKVDGIATHVLDEDKFSPLIDKAVDKGIPVITIESDAKKSRRMSFIGTNNYQHGFEGGRLIAAGTGGKARIAVVLNSYGDDYGAVAQDLKISGLLSAIKDYGQTMEIVTVKTSRMGIFSAGEIGKDIISKFPDVNAIFCTNARDTVGIAQMIVDLNKVGEITIVGYGDLPEIWRHVEKGVIYGTIVSSPVDMGYQSIKALVEIKTKNSTSSFIDTGVDGVTRFNIDEFRKIKQTEKGQESR